MGGRMLRAPTRGQPGLVAAASRCHRPKAPNKGQIHGAGAAPWAGDTGALWSLWHGEGPSVPVGTASARGCCRGLPALISMERRFPAKKPEKRLGLLQSSPKESRSPPRRAGAPQAEPSVTWEFSLILPLSLQVFYMEIRFLATHFG